MILRRIWWILAPTLIFTLNCAENNSITKGSRSSQNPVAPSPLPDTVLINQNTSKSIHVLGNDSDDIGFAFSIDSVEEPANGTATISGEFVIYTPNTNFYGKETFEYTLINSTGGTATALITVYVMTPYAWTGLAETSNWTDDTTDGTPETTNWCGIVNVHGACGGGPAPPGFGHAVFMDNCSNCDVTIDQNLNIEGLSIIDNYPGTLTQSSGVTITLAAKGWTQNSGVFSGGDSLIDINGPFSIMAGTFLASSTNTKVAGDLDISAAATFQHNNGLFVIDGSSDIDFNVESQSFNNMTIQLSNSDVNVTGDAIISGNLALDNATSRLMDGAFSVSGNVNVNNWGGGTTLLLLNGTGNQNVNIIAGRMSAIEVNNPGNTVTITPTSNNLILGGSFIYTAGTLDLSALNTLTLETLADSTIDLGSNFIPDLVIDAYNDSSLNIVNTLTATGDLDVISDSSGETIDGGVIIVQGATINWSGNDGGTATIRFENANPFLTCTAGKLPSIDINVAGTMGVAGDIIIQGDLIRTAGNFGGTGSNFYFTNTDQIIYGDGVTLGNLFIDFGPSGDYTKTIVGDLTIVGNLSLDSTGAGLVNGDDLYITGHLLATGNFAGGSSDIYLNHGAINQNITQTGGVFPGNLYIDKAGGAVNLVNTLNLTQSGQSLELITGTLNTNGNPLNINDTLTIGFLTNVNTNSANDITCTTLDNQGTLDTPQNNCN